MDSESKSMPEKYEDLPPDDYRGHVGCAFCERRYAHAHVTRPLIRMAEYSGEDPT